MGTVNDYAQLGGIWKDVWGNTIFDPFKFLTPIISDAPLEDPASEAGGIFHQPVMLTYEAGITHAAPQTSPGYGSVPYIAPNAGAVPAAQVQGAQMYGRSLVTYESLMRSLKDISGNDEDLKKAVKSATRTVMMSLGRGLAKRAEVLALHGGTNTGLGVIEADSTASPQSTTYQGTAGYYCDVSISAAEWAQGIWAMAEGSTFDVYYDNSGTATKANTTANTFLTSPQTGLVLIGVNPASPQSPVTATGRVLRFFHTSNAATGAASVVTGRALYFESGGPNQLGTSILSEPVGLNYMASIGTGTLPSGCFATAPTSLYSISSATYSQWAGNSNLSVGTLKLQQLMDYLSSPINYGVIGTKVRAMCSTKQFQAFAQDEAALRRYPGASKKAENGFSVLEYNMAGNNTLEVIGHPFQKDGYLVSYVPDEYHRVGPQDISFLKRAGQEYVLEVATAAASELRAAGQYNSYVDCPKHLLMLSGVTY